MTSFENIQIKISPRERIFQNKNQQVSKKNEILPPKCFYHSEDEIIFFCKHPHCTLPLCQKCLNIHRMEHLNKKQIPMQNVISFKESKEFVLTQLKQSKSKVKSVNFSLNKNHKAFQIQLTKYKQRLFDVIETTLNKLKDQLYVLDHENSTLKLNQISQSIDKVTYENSLTDIIKCYEQYYQKKGERISDLTNSQKQNLEETKNSIIDHIKFAVDETQLIKVVERGFLNCKFVREEINAENKTKKITLNAKLNCKQYLLQQNDSPIKDKSIKTPINKLDQLHDTSQKKPNSNEEHVSWQQTVTTNEFPSVQTEIIDVKRQERRSIFKQGSEKQKQNKPLVTKSLSFNNFAQKDIKKQLKRQPLHSDVKKYKIEDEEQDCQLSQKDNIYTKNLKFQSYTTPAQTPFVSRTRSSSSLKNRGKGIFLTKAQPLQQVDQRQKLKQTVNKMKIRLKSETNLRDGGQVSFSRQSSADWKRVVNMTDSSASSFRHSRVSNQNSNVYVVRNEPFFKTQGQQGFQHFRGIQNTDVLNPMEMRQLLMKKRPNLKTVQNTYSFV